MKIDFVLPHMGCGGAQRVAGLLAAHWSGRGWQTRIVTFDDAPPFHALPPDVEHVPLNLARDAASPFHAVLHNVRRLTALRRVLRARQPDIVISFLGDTNIKTLLACCGAGLRVVISERNNPALYPMTPVWRLLRRITYPRAAALVVQTQAIQEFFPPALQPKILRIPNPLTPPPDFPLPGESAPRVVCGMGRLHPQKGFDLLLRAFALLAPDFPDWRLRIHGGGGDTSERPKLLELIRELGVSGQVDLPGTAPDAYAALGDCAVFALPSRYEGFPNALMEAMACGRACVAADCATGPAELIVHGENGLLVPVEDVAALAAALRRLMNDPALRLRLAERARELGRRFEIAAIARQWEQVFHKADAAVERG